MKDPNSPVCQTISELLSRIGDKWTLLVIEELGSRGQLRFTQLRDGIGTVSQKMLTKTLRDLERDGLVTSAWENEHDAHADGRPARRYYKLTAPGVRALSEAAAFYRSLLPAGKPRPVRG